MEPLSEMAAPAPSGRPLAYEAIGGLVDAGWSATKCKDARGRTYVHLKHSRSGAWMDVYRVGQGEPRKVKKSVGPWDLLTITVTSVHEAKAYLKRCRSALACLLEGRGDSVHLAKQALRGEYEAGPGVDVPPVTLNELMDELIAGEAV